MMKLEPVYLTRLSSFASSLTADGLTRQRIQGDPDAFVRLHQDVPDIQEMTADVSTVLKLSSTPQAEQKGLTRLAEAAEKMAVAIANTTLLTQEIGTALDNVLKELDGLLGLGGPSDK